MLERCANDTIPALCFAAALVLAGCGSSTPPDTRAADEAAIRKADADWVKAAESKQVDAWMNFYADNAAFLPPNDKTVTGKDSIRKPVADLLGLPGLNITWQPSKVEVARAGDLGYLYGTYESSWDAPGGKRTTEHGKMVEIWKKQADGGWKCILDTWSSDAPAITPAAAKPKHARATKALRRRRR